MQAANRFKLLKALLHESTMNFGHDIEKLKKGASR